MRSFVLAPSLPAIEFDVFCQECSYNLRGLTGDRCPECGDSLAGLRSRVSGLPWTHRREAGRLKAYWKTVYLVVFRRKRFCSEMIRPVDYADGQRFRWVTILHVIVPVVVFLATLAVRPRGRLFFLTHLNELSGAVRASLPWSLLVFPVLCILFLAGGTGIPSYFFHPRELPVELQNRAIAMSYYAQAALAFAIVPLGCLIAASALPPPFEPSATWLICFAAALFGVLFFVLWSDLFHIAWRVMPGHRGRATMMAIVLPFLWLILGLLVFVVLPLVVLYVYLLTIAVF